MNFKKSTRTSPTKHKILKKVILIDGAQLASYMIEYGLGVNTATIYEIKKIDNDYFEE